MLINWYPGHMAKTKRLLKEQISRVDLIIELCDARIPLSSRNEDLLFLCPNKPRVLLLNKADLANPGITKLWMDYFKDDNPFEFDATKKNNTKQLIKALEALMREKTEKALQRGFKKTIRAMVIGVPNVGKSTLINNISGRSSLKAEDRPGVTRTPQWIRITPFLEIMDTPGMLWPKLDSQIVARRLAYIAAIKDSVVDQYKLCLHLLDDLMEKAAENVVQRYKLKDASLKGDALLESICRARGFLLSGGVLDIDRAVNTIITEFREGKLGRISLESPEDVV